MDGFQHFHDAQRRDLDRALAELRAGRKRTHWVWYVFPQLAALGRSDTAKRYGIRDAGHARAFLADGVLAGNLVAAFEALLGNRGATAEAVLGGVDAMKVRSSATLWAAVGANTAAGRAGAAALDAFYDGARDERTLELL